MADDEYEYEYDTSQTSTFLVEVDLSTLNGIKRDIPVKKYGKRRKEAMNEANDDDEERDDNDDDDAAPDPTAREASGPPQPQANNSLQFLELDRLNPMVAYKGSFYSCAWHDMIGTNMFYSLPHQSIAHTPVRQTREYNLLGTSRVKLVGQRAKVYETTSDRKRQRIDDGPSVRQNANATPNSQSDADPRPDKANPVAEVQEQANFLAKLADIQRSRQTTSDGTSLVDRDGPPILPAGQPPSASQQNDYAGEKAVS